MDASESWRKPAPAATAAVSPSTRLPELSGTGSLISLQLTTAKHRGLTISDRGHDRATC